MLTQAIAEFDIWQGAQEFIELPPAFAHYLRGADEPEADHGEAQIH